MSVLNEILCFQKYESPNVQLLRESHNVRTDPGVQLEMVLWMMRPAQWLRDV